MVLGPSFPKKHQAPGAVEEEGNGRVQQDVTVEILMALVQHAAIVAGVDVVPAQGIEPTCIGANKLERLTLATSCQVDLSSFPETSTFHALHLAGCPQAAHSDAPPPAVLGGINVKFRHAHQAHLLVVRVALDPTHPVTSGEAAQPDNAGAQPEIDRAWPMATKIRQI